MLTMPDGYEKPVRKCLAPVEKQINFEGAISFKGSGWTGKHYS